MGQILNVFLFSLILIALGIFTIKYGIERFQEGDYGWGIFYILLGIISIGSSVYNLTKTFFPKPTGAGNSELPNSEDSTGNKTASNEGTGNNTESGTVTIPDKAVEIANKMKENNGVAPEGYKGGRTYKNIPLEEGAQILPEGVSYKEYDVNPFIKGQNRGTDRLVIGDDGSVWYTDDHYYTFVKLE